MPDKLSVFIVSVPNIDLAKTISKALILESLAACVNIIPNIRSIYFWNGEIQDEAECMLTIKSQSSKYLDITARIKELHTYEVPEIIEIPIKYAEEAYAKWILEYLRNE